MAGPLQETLTSHALPIPTVENVLSSVSILISHPLSNTAVLVPYLTLLCRSPILVLPPSRPHENLRSLFIILEFASIILNETLRTLLVVEILTGPFPLSPRHVLLTHVASPHALGPKEFLEARVLSERHLILLPLSEQYVPIVGLQQTAQDRGPVLLKATLNRFGLT